MLKGLGRLWWRGVKQISKAQQKQQKKIVKALLAPPKPASVRVKPAKPAKSAKPVKRASPGTVRIPEKASAVIAAPLPGKWLSCFYTALPDGLTAPAQRMNYWLYLPHKTPPHPLPLVVMLHGCDQTATRFAQGTRMNRLAEEKGFAVLYPQQSLRGHPKRCWQWYDKATQAGGGDIRLIAGIIETVLARHPIDVTRIYAAGLSAGAAMAHILALSIPHRIAAVGLHSGPVYGAGHTPMAAYGVMQGGSVKAAGRVFDDLPQQAGGWTPMPAILIQGSADRVVRPVNQMQLAQQFKSLNRLDAADALSVVTKPGKRAGVRPAAHPYTLRDYVVARKLLLRVCEISGLEHAWSGGDCTLEYNACFGPDASRMMWDFFARHRRRASVSV